MIEWLRGIGLWLAIGVFILGSVYRIVQLYRLSRKKDGIIYNHVSFDWAARSIGHWLIPLGARSLRGQPLFALACYLFHALLFIIPLFLVAHNTLLQNAFGVSLPSLPNRLADVLTLAFLAAGAFLALRRFAREEVRIITSAYDYGMIALTLIPFATGYMASHAIGDYTAMLFLHILSSELVLAIIPFTKLFHAVLFFFTRAFIGFEMGTRRGTAPW